MGNTQQKLENPSSSYSSDEDEDDDQISNTLEEEEEEEICNENSSSSSCRFFTCGICLEHFPINQKFKNNNTNDQMTVMNKGSVISRCPEDHPFCTGCIAKYIHVKLHDQDSAGIKCPNIYCDNVLDPLSCRSIIPSRVFVRWCDVLCQSAVQASFPSRAYCPFPYCSELVLNECAPSPPPPRPRPFRRWRYWRPWRRTKNKKITTRPSSSKCPNCRNLFCFQCMIPWHESHRCKNDDNEILMISNKKTRKRNDKLFLETVQCQKWKRCPSCKHYIERFEGCSLIECRCGTEFCYDCGRKEAWCVCYERFGSPRRWRRDGHDHDNRANCFIKPLILTLRSLFR